MYNKLICMQYEQWQFDEESTIKLIEYWIHFSSA